uniref:Major sperm protein n=1 Tax=Caenorhabditis tropicalis TaxID=1561998 RepID=A0A1I7UNV6_9PELO
MEQLQEDLSSKHKQYIVLDQIFVVFDIDQPKNACQKLKLNRLAGVGPIYWRFQVESSGKNHRNFVFFQTNAPARYIVTPNQGVLRDDEPIEVSVTLYQNRFRPRHEIFLQAIPVPENGDFDPKKLFEDLDNAQVTFLDLGTTVMKIESALESSKSATDLHQALDASASVGADRVEQLQSILNLTNSDTEQLANNIEQAKKLKVTLDAQLEQRKGVVGEYKSKLAILEGSYMRKSAEVHRLQNELQNMQKTNAAKAMTAPNPNTKNCVIS